MGVRAVYPATQGPTLGRALHWAGGSAVAILKAVIISARDPHVHVARGPTSHVVGPSPAPRWLGGSSSVARPGNRHLSAITATGSNTAHTFHLCLFKKIETFKIN